MFGKSYDWWCEACERGCDDDEGLPLEEDSEGYVLCPTCGNRLIGFDER
jgi:hypothetical protein